MNTWPSRSIKEKAGSETPQACPEGVFYIMIVLEGHPFGDVVTGRGQIMKPIIQLLRLFVLGVQVNQLKPAPPPHRGRDIPRNTDELIDYYYEKKRRKHR